MKNLFICICFLLQATTAFSEKSNAWTLYNSGWEFYKDADSIVSARFFEKQETPDPNWKAVTLPHTANIEPLVIKGDQWQGICLYRKFFYVPESDQNKRIAIYFEAAMNQADVYLNGKLLASHVGGYLPFEVELTGLLRYDEENCLLVKLNNRDNPLIPPGKPLRDLDFNYFSGLYRSVYWVAQDKLHFPDAVAANRKSGGAAMIHFEKVGTEAATLIIQTEIKNDYAVNKTAQLRWTLRDQKGKAVSQILSEKAEIGTGEYQTFYKQFVVLNPHLWSPENPYLYTIKIDLLNDGKVIDQYSIRTGIRAIEFKTDGFYLNGAKLRIRGTNRHQEYPYVGYALPDQAQYRDAWKIKGAGFNFVRCSHYPQSPAFLHACDELGIMVMDAIPGWQFFGNDEFQKNSLQDVRDMVRRDRNHPSIILWEASLNESGMSVSYMESAHRIVHEELPFPDVFTCGWTEGVYDVFIPARQHAKPPYYWNRYAGNKPVFIAEYGDWEYYAQNAGFNQKTYSNLKESERSSRQLRGDGQTRLLQQALNYQESLNDNYNGNVAGDANWLMFDYNRGYAPDIESSGIMDIFRLPKFSFYFYQSQDGPVSGKDDFGKPMVFIANYFDGLPTNEIRIFSNCEEVELRLNGKLIDRRVPDRDSFSTHLPHAPFTFKIPGSNPGTLLATGFINGKKVAQAKQISPTKPLAIKLKADFSGKEPIRDKPDLLFIYASVTDIYGTVLSSDSSAIRFKVQGPAELIGDNPIRAEAGIATILLKTTGMHGRIKVSGTAPGFLSTTLTLKSHRPK